MVILIRRNRIFWLGMRNMSSLDLLIVEGEVQLGVDVGGVILQRKIRGLLVKEREMDSEAEDRSYYASTKKSKVKKYDVWTVSNTSGQYT